MKNCMLIKKKTKKKTFNKKGAKCDDQLTKGNHNNMLMLKLIWNWDQAFGH